MIYVAGNVGNTDKREIDSKKGKLTVLNFSIAENLPAGKDESGKTKTRTNWYRVSIFGKYADAMAPYITKGSIVSVSGDLSVSEYKKKDGGTGFEMNIENPRVSLLGNRVAKGETTAPASATDSSADSGFIEVPDGVDEIPFA